MSDINEQDKVEEKNKVTVIEVPIPETEKDSSVEEVDKTIDDSTAEEQFGVKDALSSNSEKVKQISEEQKEYLLKRAKEANINFDELECDERGIPKISDEMLEIFSIYSNGLFDKDFLGIYIDQAMAIIDQYFDFKDMIDKGMTDEDDMEYYTGLGKSYEESRLILGMIQSEYKKIVSDFENNKIFEHQSKALTLSLLRDYFVDKFKLTDSWLHPGISDVKEIAKFDKTIELENDIRTKMFVAPIFKQYAYRMYVKSKVDRSLGSFSSKFLNYHFNELICGLSSYIKYSGETHDIDIKTIITRDMNSMNFIKAVLTLCFIENDDPFVKSINLKEESIETLKNKLNPDGIYTKPETENKIFESLYIRFKTLYEHFSDIQFITRLYNECVTSLKTDKVYKIVNLDIDEPYENFIVEFSGKLPDITGTSIMRWGEFYSYLKKYELYHSVKLVKELLSTTDESKTEEYKRTMIIDCITTYLVEYLNMIYGKMLSDIDEFIKDNVYSAQVRPTMFSMLENNLLMQHELGFKSDFRPDENSSGDKLYELAEKVFGEQYKFIIIDKEKDVLLKSVDLKETRMEYFKTVEKLEDLMIMCAENLMKGDYIETPVQKSKKNKKHKRR